MATKLWSTLKVSAAFLYIKFKSKKEKLKMKIKEKVKNERAIVRVKIFGHTVEEYSLHSDNPTITTDVITDYINSGEGDNETREVAEELMRFMGNKVVKTLIRDFDDRGDFIRELLEMSIDIAPTESLRENAIRLRRIVLPLLGRVYVDKVNQLTPKEQNKFCGYTTCESVITALLTCSWISDGIMSFAAEI